MYSIQALWTAAHHDLPIVFVILANREYRVLKHNIDAYRARFDVKSNKPYMHMDLSGPVLGFVDLAKGMGVAGTHVTKGEDIQKAVAAAFKSGKPHLIEIEIEEEAVAAHVRTARVPPAHDRGGRAPLVELLLPRTFVRAPSPGACGRRWSASAGRCRPAASSCPFRCRVLAVPRCRRRPCRETCGASCRRR